MDVFENLALNLIVKKEVNDYLKKYSEKLRNIEKIKKMISNVPVGELDSPMKKLKK